MPFEDCVVPNNPKTAVRLYYDHTFDFGNRRFDYLHMIRSRFFLSQPELTEKEVAYWEELDRHRNQFANGLEGEFDLLVGSPSRSGFHRPYVAAFAAKLRAIPYVHFVKTSDFTSDQSSLDEIRKSIKCLVDPKGKLGDRQNVLIVDDVFATGKTTAAVIDKLREAGLPVDVQVTSACPLWVPPNLAEEAKTFMEQLCNSKL